jgi:hypothetical protein
MRELQLQILLPEKYLGLICVSVSTASNCEFYL